jgi:hypothetical protein
MTRQSTRRQVFEASPRRDSLTPPTLWPSTNYRVERDPSIGVRGYVGRTDGFATSKFLSHESGSRVPRNRENPISIRDTWRIRNNFAWGHLANTKEREGKLTIQKISRPQYGL